MKHLRCLNAAAALLFASATFAQTTPPTISAPVEQTFQRMLAAPSVKAALKAIEADDERTLRDQIELTEIPAPPFKEAVKAVEFLKRVRAMGFADSRIDSEGNVIAVRKGVGNGSTLVVSAHLDTVFPEGTDVKVKKQGERYLAPGIYDDNRGLAALLSVMRAMQGAQMKTTGDVWFVATVGEEELGDLRGVKALFRDHKNIDGFISLDGLGIDRVVNAATGSRRFKIGYVGPGGHSFAAFGMPSATHAMGRAIAKMADVETPTNPKTTFTVGTVKGGTSVNAIAADAEIGLDMRSNSAAELSKLEEKMLAIARAAADEENARWKLPGRIKAEIKLVGDRPAGSQAIDSVITQIGVRSAQALGVKEFSIAASSTDSNTPIALGIPAVTLGGGGIGGGAHSPGEWYSPLNAWLGPQNTLLATLALAGIEGVSEPLLMKRAR
ncbi:MAG: M20/M25/M40 family metallo-hydrolase [Betaproteobacteria bacterium]|nr:MAG: M20/M25/M40 family metallo-hydrolase [Betaproteobacteria bacterium]